MKTSDLLYYLNKGSLNELLPITNVQTNKDVEKNTEDGYSVVPIEKIKETIPDLSEENIAYLCYSKCAINGLFYYDKERAILFETPIYVSNDCVQCIKPYKEETINEIIKNKKHRMERMLWTKFHFHIIPERYRLELFLNNFDKINDEDKYQLFKEIYTSVDYGSELLTKEFLKKIRGLKEREKNPEEYIRIYRGIGDKSNPNGFSYSTDFDIARFFAFRHSKSASKVTIIEGRVKKKNIVADISIREEREIIALPEDLEDRREITLYGVAKYLSNDIIKLYSSKRNEFLRTMKFIDFKSSCDHDENHMLRVLLFSIILTELHNEKGIKGIKGKIKEGLLTAAMFHDIGRTHDDEDERHGLQSYEKWKKFSKKENDLVRKLMESHSLKEEKEDWFETEEEKAAYRILKDADALDRQRFGLRELNSDFLRFDFSKELTFAAYQMQDYGG